MPPLPSQVKKFRPELAVNLLDLDRVEPLILSMLLGGKLDQSRVIRMDRNAMDEMGVAFTCDTVTAAACCDTLRNRDKGAKQYPTRVYRWGGRAWSKVPGNMTLTVIQGDEVVLNPAVFRVEAEEVEMVPPPYRRLKTLG